MNTSGSAKFWIASGNQAKVKELRDFSTEYFPGFGSPDAREPKDVVENESTFRGNAKLKAHALVQELLKEGQNDFVVLADDSGLCVDLLNGEPGIYSARYSSRNSSAADNVETLLTNLGAITLDLKKRSGRYHCALTLVRVSGGHVTGEYCTEEIREGLIAIAPKGKNGYAYDSIFLDPETLLSYGEISYEKKQQDSHRHRAFKSLRSLMLEGCQ